MCNVRKAMLSQPMAGRTEEEIRETRRWHPLGKLQQRKDAQRHSSRRTGCVCGKERGQRAGSC